MFIAGALAIRLNTPKRDRNHIDFSSPSGDLIWRPQFDSRFKVFVTGFRRIFMSGFFPIQIASVTILSLIILMIGGRPAKARNTG